MVGNFARDKTTANPKVVCMAMFSAIFTKRKKSLVTSGIDLDEVAHNEPPHQDLYCLQIQPFSSLVLREIKGGILLRKIISFLQYHNTH